MEWDQTDASFGHHRKCFFSGGCADLIYQVLTGWPSQTPKAAMVSLAQCLAHVAKNFPSSASLARKRPRMMHHRQGGETVTSIHN